MMILGSFAVYSLFLVLLEQAKFLGVEFKYLTIFSIGARSTLSLLNENKNTSSPN